MPNSLDSFDPFAPQAKSLDDFDPFAQPAAPTQATPATPAIARPSGIVRRVVGDTVVDLGIGATAARDAAVGIGNLVSGGQAGKWLEDNAGYKPGERQKVLESFHSPERQAADKEVADAKGFMPTIAAAIRNPSTIAGAAAQSAPLMIGGGAVARGLGAIGKIASPVARGAIGEGVVGAGLAAENIRQRSEDGLLNAKQTGAALASGAGTAVLGALGGKVAQKLGIADVDVALAGGSTLSAPKKNILRRAAEGMLAEGVFEELPQSAQETMWQNYATGKPIMDGVAEASAMGALAGGVMGGGFSAISRPGATPAGSSNPTATGQSQAEPPAATPAGVGGQARPSEPVLAGTADAAAAGTDRQANIGNPDLPVSSPSANATPDPFDGEVMNAELDAAMGAQSGLDRAQSGQEPTPPSVAGMPEPVVNRVQEAADNLRAQAADAAATAQTGIKVVAAMALNMQADAIEQEAPLDRLARVSAAAGIDPAEAVKAHQAYDPEDPDGASFAELPDEVLSVYARTLLEDAARGPRQDAAGPQQEQPDVAPVRSTGDDPLLASRGQDQAGSGPSQADGLAAEVGQRELAVSGDAAGAQAQGVTDAPPPGKVRVYTGSAVEPGEFIGDQYFSTSRDYAQGYADKNPGSKVYAVDVDEALLEADIENGIPGRDTLTLPDTVARTAAEATQPEPAAPAPRPDTTVQSSAAAQPAGVQADQSVAPLPSAATTAPAAGQALESQSEALPAPVAGVSSPSSEGGQGSVKAGGKDSALSARDANVPANLIAARDAADARSKAASAAMQAFPSGEMGLTPDAVKATPEWKAARIEMDRAMTALRTANSAVNVARKTAKAKPAIEPAKTRVVDGVNEYHYVDGQLGMASSGKFTADQSRWMSFSRDEVARMGDATKPYGASRAGVFTPAVAAKPAPKKPRSQMTSKELKAQEAGKKEQPAKTDDDRYNEKLAEWDGKAKKFGKARILEQARSAVAGNFIGRDFNESADTFYASNPTARATRDWLRAQDGAAPAEAPKPSTKRRAPTEAEAAEGIVASQGPSDAKGERKFYVTIMRDSKVARLAGPFDTKAEADGMVDRASSLARELDSRAAFDSFGVSAVTSENHKPGKLNERLGLSAPPVETIQPDRAEAKSEAPKPKPTPNEKAKAEVRAKKAAALATHADPGEAPEVVTPAVIAEAAKTADRAPTVSMADARKALLAQLDAAIKTAPKEGVLDNPPTTSVKKQSGKKAWEVDIGRTLENGLTVPTLTIVESHDGNNYSIGLGGKMLPVGHKDNTLSREGSLLAARLMAARMQQGATWAAKGKAGEWKFAPSPASDADMLTLDVPGDGKFKVPNTKERLQAFRKQVEAFFKLPATPKVPGYEPSVSLTASDAQRAKVMAEAETVDAQPEAAKPAARVTPQVATDSRLASFIAIAADSVDKLRSSDVERVLREAPAQYRLALAEHIKAKRRDLAAEVDEVMADSAPPVEAAQQDEPATVKESLPVAGTLALQDALYDNLRDGAATLEEYKAGWQALQDNREAILAELASMKKDALVKIAGMRARSETKPQLVKSAFGELESNYSIGRGISYGMTSGNSLLEAYAAQVERTTDADLKAFADKWTEARAARAARITGASDPKTLSEFEDAARLAGGETKLSADQRATFDRLRADARREQRDAEAKRNAVVRQVDTGGTGMDLVETTHTQKGHALFVVKMAERVEADTYKALNAAAKRLGGYYSSFRGNGAIPGFTFTSREQAEQFMAVRDGNVDASGQQQARAEAKAESRAESLAEKAANLKAKAEESLGRERKTNTQKRAGQAAHAEAEARQQLALANTMAKVAEVIDSGEARMLGFVRHKNQVEMFESAVKAAHWDYLRAQGVQWEKAKEMPLSAESLTDAKLPGFHFTRGDAAVAARRMIATRGGKAFGESLAKLVDYGDEYGEAVRANPYKFVVQKTNGDGTDRDFAFFDTKKAAEGALARSADKLRGAVVKIPNGKKAAQWAVALHPDLAIERKLWAPDFDKKVNLNITSARKIVELLKVSDRGDQQVPYWWTDHLAKRDALAKLGIETNFEYREALREYLDLRQAPSGEDKIRKLERALVGNKAVGVDFFPTPPAVIQRLLEQADIQPGMRVLEPSAGKGDIAEAARDAAENVTVDAVEMSGTLREILEAKGFDVVAHDFLAHTSEPVYDRIVMNPPFNNDNGAAHVQHAYSMLKPGGRLVAVMGNGQRGAAAFDAWLEKVGGLSETLPEGSFKSSFRPTGVSTKIVEIDRGDGPLESVESETLADTDATPAELASLKRQSQYGFNGPDGIGMTDNERSALQVLEREESRANGIEDADKLGLRKAVNSVFGSVFGLPPIQAYYLRGKAGLDGIATPAYIKKLEDQQKGRDGKMRTAGLYLRGEDAVGGKPVFVLFTDVARVPWMAAFTAAHEVAGHHGLHVLLGKRLRAVLREAVKNQTVRKIADSMYVSRKFGEKVAKGEMTAENARYLAIEEALADLAAANATGNWQRIQDKHGVTPSKEMQSKLRAFIANVVRQIKMLFKTRNVGFSDAQVQQLLGNAFKAAQGQSASMTVVGADGALEQVVLGGGPLPQVSVSKAGLAEPVGNQLLADAKRVSRAGQRQVFARALNDVLKGAGRLGVGVASTQGRDGKAAPAKDVDQRVVRDVQRLSDLVSAKPFIEQGYGGIDAETRLLVVEAVLKVVKNLKVFDSVVEPIAVDVMNVLTGGKSPAKVPFHDVSVLKDSLAVNPDSTVAEVDRAGALVDAVALLGAEKLARSGLGERAGLSVQGRTASGAGESGQGNPLAVAASVFSQIHSISASGEGSAIGQPQSALESVSDDTREAYEARIDALFNGAKAERMGATILDRADVLGLLGFGDKPLFLAESSVNKQEGGKQKHKMTAADWKRLPEWIENPVAIFKSRTEDGRFVLFAPDLVAGRPVRIILEPNADRSGVAVHMAINAYEEGGNHVTPVQDWVKEKRLVYLDQKTSPALRERSGLQLPGEVRQLRGYTERVLTEADLVKYRAERDAQPLESTEDQTQSEAFRNWFGSSVVTEDGKAGGKPLVVYHGTDAEFDSFNESARGIFLSNDAGTAAGFGSSVVAAYVAIQNPYYVDMEGANNYGSFVGQRRPAIPALSEAIKEAKRLGHDGMVVENIMPMLDRASLTAFEAGRNFTSDWYIAFRPEQIKSATGNNGNFDPSNPSILESVEGDMFAVDTQETITAADLKIPGQIAVKREGVKGWLNAAGKKLTDLKPAALALVPLNHLADFAAKGMTAVQQYVDQHYAMQAYRNGLYRDYDAIAQDWLKFASGRGLKGLLGKVVSKQGRDLSDLMHDSTIAGIDPSVADASYKEVEKQRQYNQLRARYTALPGETVFVAGGKAFTSKIEAEKAGGTVSEMTRGQALFNRVRDSYKRQSTMLEEVIEGNLKRAMEINRAQAERTYEARVQEIEESGASADEKARLKANAANAHDDKVKDADQRVNAKMLALRKTFESMRVEAPYFPLKRYGKYWVTVLQNGTMKGFSKFETAEEQDAFVKEMEAQGFQARKKYESPDNKTHEMIDPAFIAEIEGILDGAQMPDSVKDDIWQAYLERMPDMSLRKSFIHRQKVQGYHPDALRAFSSTAFHGSYQLARLKFGMEMAETLDIAEKQAARVAPVQGEQLVGELRKRHDFIMNPTGGALAQGLTTAAFIYYLGANPAHLLLNATQTIMLGVPMLGSRHGFGRTVKALQRAMTDFAQGKGHMENANLSDDEKRAFQSFLDSGLIDKTQAHDLAGVGETGVEYNAVRQKVMNKIGWFFHQSERFNREVTAMAAYRLARNEGRGHDLAVAQAMRSTYDIHFDYSAAARARVMQGDTAKALLVFRNYNVNILYRLFRDIHQSLRGESVQVRREARKQLGGMMGMYGLFAGVAGMPFYGLAMALAGAFEDDDDPETAEQQFVRGTVELLGPDVARVLLRGVPGATFNVDLSERIGMPNLWFRSPDRELEGRDAYYYWMEQLLGAGVGVVKQGYDGSSLIFDGLQEANTGHVARGFEKMLPAALKNVFKSVRYGADGVTTLDGEKILDLGAGGLLAQGLGYTPLDLAEQYDTNRDLKNANAKLERRRRALLDRFFLAVQHGDPTDRAMTDIQAFNARNPDYAITRQTMSRSNKLRQRNSLLNENGIVMTRRMRRLQERMESTEDSE